jgi:hypothetical protein
MVGKDETLSAPAKKNYDKNVRTFKHSYAIERQRGACLMKNRQHKRTTRVGG